VIFIDDRVGAIELKDVLSGAGVSIEVTRLEFCDVCFMGNGPEGRALIGIERKRVLDLVSSMTTGRLSGHQLIGMQRDFDYCYLLVEGIWRGNPDTGVAEKLRFKKWVPVQVGKRNFMRRDIDNFLNTLSIIGGVIPWFTHNISESSRWLLSLYSWWQKAWTEHKSHKKFNRVHRGVPLERPSLVMRVAAELAGIGEGRGREFGREFGSVQDLVMAEETDIMKVKGVGKTLARSVHAELRAKSKGDKE
jgi:ERCC4-type nuclease